MSTISEQVKYLREFDCFGTVKQAMLEAADTIEALSAKLQAANVERAERYYGGDIISEILENLDKRIGAQLKIIAGLNDETQKYGYAKALDAYQQIKTYVEITLEEHRGKRPAEDCDGGWIPCEDIKNIPNNEQLVWITIEYKGGDIERIEGIFIDGELCHMNGISVSAIAKAWMPRYVPEPYHP